MSIMVLALNTPQKVLIGVIALVVIALAIFLTSVDRNNKETAYKSALTSSETDARSMSKRLLDVVKNHYKKNDYASIESDIKNTADKYSDGTEKILALLDTENFLYNQADWPVLAKFYEFVFNIVETYELDEEFVNDYTAKLDEARSHV